MDLVLRGANVVDGSGAPAQRVDVGIEGDRIVAVAPDVDGGTAAEVALDGLVLAPGFIDVHTHLDAQVLWDPDVTPCSWYGVTSVVMGNCGFGIAPTRPEHREAVMRIMESVEDMSYECLQAGIDWDFESFPEYLDTLDRVPKRINVAAMVGHTPTRLFVLGDEADERTELAGDELAQMRSIVDEALAAGAVGFATSRFPTANGRDGKPVPSRLASADECHHLAEAVQASGHGVFMAAWGPDLEPRDMARIAEELDIPVTWAPFAAKFLSEVTETTARVVPQMTTRPIVAQLNLRKPYFFGVLDEFKQIIESPPERRASVYADPSWRDLARPALNGSRLGRSLAKAVISYSPNQPALIDRRLADVADERGVDVFDAMIDVAIVDDLDTRFELTLLEVDAAFMTELLPSEHCVIALGDAGAHATQLCDACQPVSFLQDWVRERQAVSLEHAIWRLARQPADLFGFGDRGRIEVGAIADLVAFDPTTVGVSGRERVFDMPAGAERLIIRPTGIEHVWVNGVAVRRDGVEVPGAHPGRLLRGGVA
ncbi:MAG: N-acyl-D-amino-acid deacylase [Acidimicrobiaceae bacterium]